MAELSEEQIKKIVSTLVHVQTMRDLQKKYFKDRLQGDLQRSKAYERQVDTEVAVLLRDLKVEPLVVQDRLL